MVKPCCSYTTFLVRRSYGFCLLQMNTTGIEVLRPLPRELRGYQKRGLQVKLWRKTKQKIYELSRRQMKNWSLMLSSFLYWIQINSTVLESFKICEVWASWGWAGNLGNFGQWGSYPICARGNRQKIMRIMTTPKWLFLPHEKSLESFRPGCNFV